MVFEPQRMRSLNGPEFPASLNALSERVIGAAMRVHTVLGPGLRETFYEQALVLELAKRNIRCARQVPFQVLYNGQQLGEQCVDLVVESQIIVECKGIAALTEHDHAQLIGYLRFTGLPLGLLMNFHADKLKNGLVRKINWPPAPVNGDLVVLSHRIGPPSSLSSTQPNNHPD